MRARLTAANNLAVWAASAALVVALHGTIAWVLLRQPDTAKDAAPRGAFAIELAPVAVARADIPDVAPGPDQVQADAAPDAAKAHEETPVVEPPVLKAVTEPITQLVRVPDPEPIAIPEKEAKKEVAQTSVAAPPPSPPAPITSAMQTEAERKREAAATAAIGTQGAEPSVAVPRWTAKLMDQLERSKRYPAAAQGRREEGTAHVVFTIDRQGRLLSASIQKSSGSEALDTEALALLKRAAPFAPPPPELGPEHISLTVPVRFRLRG